MRPDSALLVDMMQAAQEAHELASDMTQDDLDADRLRQLALMRLLEIIGEAASRVSPEVRQSHPEIPWRDISGMRNRLIHAYFEVDLAAVLAVARNRLPELIAALEALVADQDDEAP